jgi:hypothetical protein
MDKPTRFRVDPSVSVELRSVLGSGRWSQPMSDDVRTRSAARLDRMLAPSASTGRALWLTGVAIAASVWGAIEGVSASARRLPAVHTEVSTRPGDPPILSLPPASPVAQPAVALPPPRIPSATDVRTSPAPRALAGPSTPQPETDAIHRDSVAYDAARLE